MHKVPFHGLSPDDRRRALERAQAQLNCSAHLLEKDIWVVAVLNTLFEAPFAERLTFKGGTSLSKVWCVISRFSEDVDITYDIRALAPDLVSGAGNSVLPQNRSQEKRWTKTIRTLLSQWVRETACPTVADGLATAGFDAKVRPCKENLYISYNTLFEEDGYVRPAVMIDFGARSTGEPRSRSPVVCDAAAYLPDLAFPEAHPTAMLAERTFWEKATAIHVFCCQQRRRGERLARHWHDLVRLDEAGVATHALARHELALDVARHKAIFFVENDAHGQHIDYEAAVSGELQLVPTGAAHALLANDYTSMLDSGMLRDGNESFDALMQRCARIQERANGARR